jgi:hypothetical protein
LIGTGKELEDAVKRMITGSTIVCEAPFFGAILKLNNEIAAKIVLGAKDLTEYTSLQYLSDHPPDIPAPRPHGLLKFSYATIMLIQVHSINNAGGCLAKPHPWE